MVDPRFGQAADEYGAFLNVEAQATASLVATQYLTTVNSNPSFEVNTNDWGDFNCTFTRANDQSHDGAWSAKIVPNGSSTACGIFSGVYPATAGLFYGVSGWARCASSRSIALKIDWRDASNSLVGPGSVASTTPIVANTWTFYQGIFLAPATVTGFNFALIYDGVVTIPSSDILWGDELRLWTVDNHAEAVALLAPHGEVWNINRTFVKASSNVLEASAFTYRGQIGDQYQLDSSFAGSSGDQSDTAIILRDGDQMWTKWVGGDLGATYTVTVNGWRTTPEGGFRGRRV
jgi:hypothetical protein